MTHTIETQPAPRAPAVDPAAELIRAALAWRYNRPGVAEATSNLLRAVLLYEESGKAEEKR